MIAYSQTVSGRMTDGVLLVTIDNPPVNAASADMRSGLFKAIEAANADPGCRAIVLTGTGKSFVGGADIREFGQPMADPILPQVVSAIEASAKPVIAAINGVALGGGAEIAIACHFRLADRGATIGFPEVKLGIVPGSGGTQRLPRLVGMAEAIGLAASGRPVTAARAGEIGLVDAIAETAVVADAIRAATDPSTRFRRTGDLPVGPIGEEEIDAAGRAILAKARGQDAPKEAVRLVVASARLDLADGLAEERATFVRLRDSLQAKALRHVFFAERAAAKIEGLDGVEPRPVRHLGIVGLGLMGSGIAVAALDAGFRVTGVDRDDEAAAAGGKRIRTIHDRAVKSGRMSQEAADECQSRLTLSSGKNDLATCDMVIEAVFDDMAVKTALFAELDQIVRPDAILATNTSYLDPDVIAAATRDPSRVLGLHFFSPANVMRLVELVRLRHTAPEVLAAGLAVAKRMRKLAVPTGVTEGFIGNRIFSAYRRQAEYLLEDGALPQDIDRAMEDFGMAMGPFAVFDLAGLDIAWARRKRDAARRDPAERYVVIADRLCEAGRFGQKSGAGWYSYTDGKKAVDPLVTAIIEQARTEKAIVPRTISAGEIVDSLVAAMAAEGRRLLDEGIASRSSDIDLVMINGYGFPAHRGGPMFMADNPPG